MPCGVQVNYKGKNLRGTPSYAQSWNYTKFATDSYNLTGCGESWCVKPKSIYTNPDANFNYFKTCGDPYTYYNYWYRRFPDQTNYLNCYFLPYSEPNYYKNKYGYIKPNGNCKKSNNLKFNTVDNGFKFFDRKINP